MSNTNLLAMPLVLLQVETGNNEDWVDSLLFVVDNGSGDPTTMQQLDLSGINFEMEIRRTASDSEVIIAASTADGTLVMGEPPNYGYLIFNVLIADMQNVREGSYVGDIVGKDTQHIRVVARITLTIVEGVTKQPVNQRVIVQVAA